MDNLERENTIYHDVYEEFRHRIKWLYLGRMITIAPCLIVYILIGSIGKFLPDIRWLFVLVVFESFFNAPYGFILKRFYRAKKENLLISIMLGLDVFATTVALHIVGLQDGLFFGALYLITIIFAGILAAKGISYIIATLAAVCYGGLAILEYNGVIPHIPTIGIRFTAVQMSGWVISHILFFYIVAYLSNFYTKPIKLHEEELYWWSKNLEKRLNMSHAETIAALVRALKVKDPYMEVHSSNVAWYSLLIARAMGLSQQMIDDIKDACFLHDIGKIGISDEILTKNGTLTMEEREKMKHHPEFGAEIIAALSGTENVARMIVEEHEHYNGKGYPKGLKRDEICLGAQIIAVADAFDVLVSRRPYKEPYPPDRAMGIIKDERGKQFSPVVVDSFCKIYEENKDDVLMFIKKTSA